MISVWGRTYRIVSAGSGTYDAIRLLDDVLVGSFGDGPSFRVNSPTAGEALLRQIAETAIRLAKTRWMPRPSR
jgi:hypothetical protein